MGGAAKKDKEAERDLANKQVAQGDKLIALSEADSAKAKALQDPAIQQYMAMASGDMDKILPAASFNIGQYDKAYQRQKESIMANIPAGAARDYAMSKLEVDRPAQQATFINSVQQASFDKLANLGAGLGAFSLQELGGGARFSEASSNTRSSVMQADAQGKAATLGFLGSLAGGVGAAVGGKK